MIDQLMLLDWQRRIGPLNDRFRSATTQAEREAIADEVLDALAVNAAEHAFVAAISAPGKLSPAEVDQFLDDLLKARALGWCRTDTAKEPDVSAQELHTVLAPTFWNRVRELQAATSETWGRA